MSAGAMTLVFVLLGMGSWAAEYRVQRTARLQLMPVRLPRWIAWLCGNPTKGGTIDLESGARQLGALAFLAGAPLTYLVGLEPHRQAALVFLAYAAVALPALVYVELNRWRAERERNMLEGNRAPRPTSRRRMA